MIEGRKRRLKAAQENGPSRAGRPRRDEIESRLFNLLDTAADIFIRHGYAGTSIDRIASTAKVGKPTIYARFGDKAGLLKAVVDHVLKHRTMPIDRPISARTGVEALKEQLSNLLSASIEPSYVGLFRLYLNEGPRFPDIFAAFSAQGEPHRLLVEQIEKHEEFRELLPRKDELALALLSLNGMLVVTSAVQPGFRETLSPQAEASRFVDICLFGFFGGKAREKSSPVEAAGDITRAQPARPK